MKFVSATFSAELRSLKEIQKFLRESARAADFSALELDRLDLVMEEIAVNVCRHAYSDAQERPLRIDCAVEGKGEIMVRVADRGVPFDPRTAPVPNLNAELKDRPVGGLGLFVVSHLARVISYERSDGWNRLSVLFSSSQDST